MNESGPLPKVTEYDLRYERARKEIGSALFDMRQKHNLTASQYISVLAGAISETLKFCMRAEREDEAKP